MKRTAVTVLLCGAALAAAAPAQASFPGGNGRLAIGPTFPGPDNSLTLISPSGARTQVSTGPVEGPANAAWSPDGRRLAFDGPATSLGSGRAIYVMNADGSGLRQVGRGDRQRTEPAWSPSGTRLAFVQDNGAAGSKDVYTVTTSGGSLTRLTTAAGADDAPDWAADGTQIAYVCRSANRDQVCLMSPTGGSKTTITGRFDLQDIDDPSWSPDSRNVAFDATPPSGETQVYRMSRTGTALLKLTPVEGDGPAWSPDGARVAFQQYVDDGVFGIRTMSAANGSPGPYLTTTDSTHDFDPGGWQPLR